MPPAFTASDLEKAQDIYNLLFPPDLIAFLSEDQPLKTYDWRTDNQAIRQMLCWPEDGLIFDVEHNALWLDEWGERPSRQEHRAEVVRQAVAAAPRLIPIFAHRFLPSEPSLAGNPVFSVYQADIIVYGANLDDYIEREINDRSSRAWPEDIRRIRFWSDLVDRNNGYEGVNL